MNPPTVKELLEQDKWGCTDGFYDYEVVMKNYAATIYHRLYDGTFWRLETDVGLAGTNYSLNQVEQRTTITYEKVK